MAMSLNQIGGLSAGTPVASSDSGVAEPTTVSASAVWRSPPPNIRVSVQKEVERLSPSPPMSPMRGDLTVACEALMTGEREHRLLLNNNKSGKEGGGGVPVYVMMPLDSVTMNNGVNRRKAMNASLKALKSAGVEGIMMDVWWGLVEREAPGEYNWGGYADLLDMAGKHGLKVQAVMSFHQCGGNVGDSCTIPLPKWVLEEINNDPDLAYTDQWGRRNNEYISLGCDTIPCLKGRTPIQCYSDYMRSFRDKFSHLLGDTIVEIQVGMGPAGELRYPSYPEKDGVWRFPGIGAFQCYDKYMLSSLKAAAENYGKPEWGSTGPTDAGEYNNWPEDTNFFKKENGGWNSEYGDFFLTWYSQMLLDHGERILSATTSIFQNHGVKISVKVAGIHWHYGTRSHAPELTAGYYNTRYRDGYLPIARMLARHGAVFNFTCIEMRDHEQPQVRIKQSGCNDLQVFERALADYEKHYRKPFTHHKAWHVVKTQLKWLEQPVVGQEPEETSKKRKSSDSSNAPTPRSVNDIDCELPNLNDNPTPSRQSRGMKKKSVETSSSTRDSVEVYTAEKTILLKAQLEAQRKKDEKYLKFIETEEYNRDMKFVMDPHEHIQDPAFKEFIIKRKREFCAKYGWPCTL